MPKQNPFLYRRGDVLAFRIAVPLELRPFVGCREITKSLRTPDKHLALPIALELAANAKRLFYDLRKIMSDNAGDEALTNQKLKNEIEMRKVLRKIEAKESLLEIETQRELTKIKQELAIQKLKSELFDELREKDRQSYTQVTTIAPGAQETPSSHVPTTTKTITPKLSFVIESFLDSYQKNKHPAMFKKHQSALPMLLNVIGDKPINEIKQFDIKSFFALIELLPPRWSDECRKRKISIQELSKIKHLITIAPKTFKSTYIASIRAFLISAQSE